MTRGPPVDGWHLSLRITQDRVDKRDLIPYGRPQLGAQGYTTARMIICSTGCQPQDQLCAFAGHT
jgi:hypothetical protein